MSGSPKQSGHWVGVSRTRFAPLGVSSATPTEWAGRAAVGLLAIALVAFLYALFRPLPSPPAAFDGLPDEVDAPLLEPTPIDQRDLLIAGLTEDNPFSPTRGEWRVRIEDTEVAGSSGASGDTSAGAPDGDAPDEQIEFGRADAGDEVVDDILVTREEDLEPTLLEAYRNLELKGILTGRSGPNLALVSFVRSPNRGTPSEIRVGEEFKDDTFPQHDWRLLHIDTRGDRIVVRREGVNVVVPLFRSVASAVEPEQASDAGAVEDPESDAAQRAEMIAALREAGVPAEELAEIFVIVDEMLEEEDAALASAPAEPIEPPKTLEEQAEAYDGDAGLKAIMNLMKTGGQQSRVLDPSKLQKKLEERNQANEPDEPAERK